MKVAIIIPTPDASKWPATGAIEIARQTTNGFNVEVIPIVSSGPDFSFAKSINRGFRESPDADAWVLLNDDCFMDAGWLQAMLEVSKAHPNAGIIAATLRYEDGTIQLMGTSTPKTRIESALWFVRQNLPQWIPTPKRYYEPDSVDTLIAACMMITRPCFDALGLFDERYPMSFEDSDYCLRARENGFGIILAEGATGLHLGEHSSRHLSPVKKKSYGVFRDIWSLKRIQQSLKSGYGIIHPSHCRHGEGER